MLLLCSSSFEFLVPSTLRLHCFLFRQALPVDRRPTPASIRGGGAIKAYHAGESIDNIMWWMRIRTQEHTPAALTGTCGRQSHEPIVRASLVEDSDSRRFVFAAREAPGVPPPCCAHSSSLLNPYRQKWPECVGGWSSRGLMVGTRPHLVRGFSREKQAASA